MINPGPKPPVTGLQGAVTTDSEIATHVMLDILKRGGNAADAAVAGSLVQAAIEPHMTSHAGAVTCLLYEQSSGKTYQLDSMGGFPSGLSPFKPLPSHAGPYAAYPPAAVIPGFMPGLKALHARFGSLNWAELCAPAIAWAESGHPVSTFEYGMNVYGEKFFTYFAEARAFLQPRGMFTPVGDTFIPTGLASTLRGVADEGPDYMMTGPWAREFITTANRMGWNITLEHMTETPPRWLEPIRYPHRDLEIVSLGPPQVQGLYISLALGILKHLGLRNREPGSAEHIWAMGHALRQAARHWEYVQDDRVYEVPRDELLDDAYHAHLARLILRSRPKIDLSQHVELSGYAGGENDVMHDGGGGKPRRASSDSKQPTGSCEIAVVDQHGNWVQMMNTLQGGGIPGMVVGGVPMMGSHATFGNLMSPMDATLVPGARGRCVVGNTFVLRAGRPIFSAGSPGHVHCTVPQVLANRFELNMTAHAAVEAPRMLPMTEARAVIIEDRLPPNVVEDLHRIGVRVAVTPAYDTHMGSFSVIERDEVTGTYTAIADSRRCAVADGIR